MNFQLTQEQEMLVDSVRSFVEKELLPYEEQVDRADEVSPELAAQIRGKAIAAGVVHATSTSLPPSKSHSHARKRAKNPGKQP